MSPPAQGPGDPFSGAPDDVPEELPDEGVVPPLPPAERGSVLSDLEDLEVLQALLEPRGVQGLAVGCADCGDRHYVTWDLLRGNLRALLDTGRGAVHEPAYAPDASAFVTWDYARGFADAALEG